MGKSSIFLQTFKELQSLAEKKSEIIISYSGGKDSMVVLDICSKVFKRVVCFTMYIFPGLSVVEQQIQYARERYGIEVLQYPHWLLSRWLKYGVYCKNYFVLDNIPECSFRDVIALVRQDTNIDIVATGQRRTEDVFRYMMLSKEQKNLIHPIKNWHRYDVLAYMKYNNIPIPDGNKNDKSGIDLSEKSLCWLYDNHPEDFTKILKLFPFAEVPIYRRKFYGQELDSKTAKKKQSRVQPEKNHQA